ncbi:MAG: alpha/beta hydrolase [Eggerthellaceae bacterium]|nr:alpha/beta hydrolase [Eggerthellaceae bacterium]
MTDRAFTEREFIPFNDNPFGLVYDEALTENVEGAVNIRAIQYPYRDFTAVANVYVPAGYDEAGSYPAVVVAHPNGGVKEQVAGTYAQKLAENGYVALAFDAAYQGESGGEPRSTDWPENRVEDIHRAADILLQYPGVDPGRVAVLGICGGGGYTFKAAQTDKRFKAVATLSLFNSGEVRREGFRGSQVDTIQERLAAACEARQAEAAGQPAALTPNMCETATPAQADAMPYDLYREGYYYYGRDCAHPGSTFSYTVSSLIELAAFDARDGAQLIDVPLLMMMGSRADTGYMTIDCYERAVNAPVRELLEIPGATHIQTYWKPEYVEQATAKLVAFLGEHL